MIKLNKDYAINFDTMNIILYKISISGEKSKNPGEEVFNVIGYFGSFEHLVDKLIKDKIGTDNPDTLQEIIDNINSFKKDILSSIIELKPDTKPYKYKLEEI